MKHVVEKSFGSGYVEALIIFTDEFLCIYRARVERSEGLNPAGCQGLVGGRGRGRPCSLSCPDPSSWTSEHSDGTQARCCIAGLGLCPQVVSHCCCDIHETEWLGDCRKTLLFFLSCSSAGPVFN